MHDDVMVWATYFYDFHDNNSWEVASLGAMERPKDLTKGKTRFIEEALKDLSPELRESVMDILKSWEEGVSEGKLAGLVGLEKAKRITKSVYS